MPRPYWASAPRIAAWWRRTKGAIKGEIYATELIGDHTLVTLKAGSDLLTVKAAKDFTAKLGEKAGVAFGTERLFVFDESNGLRVR